jgi:hypothetical protein
VNHIRNTISLARYRQSSSFALAETGALPLDGAPLHAIQLRDILARKPSTVAHRPGRRLLQVRDLKASLSRAPRWPFAAARHCRRARRKRSAARPSHATSPAQARSYRTSRLTTTRRSPFRPRSGDRCGGHRNVRARTPAKSQFGRRAIRTQRRPS